jgi:hypothetical protein
MYNHELLIGQLVRDRGDAFTREATGRSFATRRADRRPPPGRHLIDGRVRWRRRLSLAG